MKRIFKSLKRFWKYVFSSKWSTYVLFTLIICFVIFLITRINYNNPYLGFSKFSYKLDDNEFFIPAKTLWDWLELLIIPIALVLGGYFLNRSEKRLEIKLAEEKAKTDRKIAEVRNQEIILGEYFDRMSDLLIEKQIHGSESDSVVRDVARTRTLSVLRRIYPDRKAIVLKFLYESELIIKKQEREPLITLKDADLQGLELEKTEFFDIDLSGANLFLAKFKDVRFINSNLNDIDFSNSSVEFCFFNNVELMNSVFDFIKLNNVSFDKCNFNGFSSKAMEIINSSIINSDLSNAEIKSAEIKSVEFKNNEIVNTDCENNMFEEVQLEKLDFKLSNLSNTIFKNCDLREVNLKEVRLVKSIFDGVKITDCNLKDTDFERSTLIDTIIENSNQESARFRSIITSNVNFNLPSEFKKNNGS